MSRSFRLSDNDVLAQLARRQGGLLARAQLAQGSVSEKTVRAALHAQRWAELSPLVIATFTGPLPLEAQQWAAVLNAGPGAALCGRSALSRCGLQGWEGDLVEVVVDRGHRPPSLPFVTVHESRRHAGTDVTFVRGLPTHTVERAAVDMASWAPSARTAVGVLAAVVQQRMTTPERVLQTWDTQGRIRRRGLIAASLHDLSGGSQALSELDFLRLFRRSGVPEPIRQSVRRDAAGRRRYLDMEWALTDGTRRVLEIDGIGHMSADRWYDDLLREADLVTVGPDTRILRLPAAAARAEPERVLSAVRRFLGPAATPANLSEPRAAMTA